MTSHIDNGPSDRLPRLHMLDGLRGLCAVSLMFYHLFAWTGITQFQVGTFGVYLFYVLSGFSMWYVYAYRPLTISLLKKFFVARFARIFPLYFLVTLLSLAARLYAEGKGSFSLALLQRFLLNITFLFGFNDPGKASIMPGGWSIGIEWVFYFLFPLLLLGLRRLRVMLALLAVGIVLNLTAAGTVLAGQTLEAAWIPYTQFPTFFVYFIAGITAAELFTRLNKREEWLPPVWQNILSRLLPALAVLFIFLYPSATVEEYLRGAHVILLIAAAMLAMIAGALLRNPTGVEIRLYQFLGEVSYSTYLLFFFVYHAAQTLLQHVYPAYPFAWLATVSTVGTLLLSYMSYRFFEMPARRMLNRRGQSWGKEYAAQKIPEESADGLLLPE